MSGQIRQTQTPDELHAEIDLLIGIIDDARHAAWRTGPKLEPIRAILATVPLSTRERYDDRKWAKRLASGADVPTSVRVGRAHPLREEVQRVEAIDALVQKAVKEGPFVPGEWDGQPAVLVDDLTAILRPEHG